MRPASLYPAELRRALPRGVRTPEPIPLAAVANGEELAALVYGTTPDAVYVNGRTAGGLPALDFGVGLVASAVSQMMAGASVYDADEDELPTPTIIERPYPLYTASEFWSSAVRSVLMHGNFVALYADYDSAGWPRQLVPVDCTAVQVDVTSGLPIYRLADQVFRHDEMFHIRRDAPIGTHWGLGVVAKFRKALSAQLHEQNYGESSYRSGGLPTAVIALDALTVPQEVLDRTETRWQERTAGAQRKPVVLPKTISVTPLSWSPEDADYVNARQLSVADCAFMVGLSPSDLEAGIGGQSLTYANITDRSLARITQSYAPMMALFEEALSNVLPGAQRVRGNIEALLRSTTRERYELHQLAQAIGIETTAETRAIEKRPALEGVGRQ